MQIPKQLPPWVKPGACGAVAGIVLAIIVGFGTGWVVTSGSAQQTAERQAEKAVIASLTPICVAQFENLSEKKATTALAALEGENSWQRGDFLQQQGWATMPGGDEPRDAVAAACASELMKFAENPDSK